MNLAIRICMSICVMFFTETSLAQSKDSHSGLNLHVVEVVTAEYVKPIYTTGTVLALRTTELVPLVGGYGRGDLGWCRGSR